MKKEYNLSATLLTRKTVMDFEKHPKPRKNHRLQIGLGSICLLSCGAYLVLEKTPVEYETMIEVVPYKVEEEKLTYTSRIHANQNSDSKNYFEYDEENNLLVIESYLMKEGSLTVEHSSQTKPSASFLSDTKRIESYQYKESDFQKEYNIFGQCLNCDEIKPNMMTVDELQKIKTK